MNGVKPNGTQLNDAKLNRQETKKPAQQLKTNKEAQLANPLRDKNINPAEAIEVYHIAKGLMDRCGNVMAQNQLGLEFLLMPSEFLQNPVTDRKAFDIQAFMLFQLAAEGGNKEGQNNLGYMYEKGRGVERNISAALKYYKMAADKGLEVAKFNYDRLNSEHLVLQGRENSTVRSNFELMQNHLRRSELDKKNSTTTTAKREVQDENRKLKDMNKAPAKTDTGRSEVGLNKKMQSVAVNPRTRQDNF
jgi:TPR repeat protein